MAGLIYSRVPVFRLKLFEEAATLNERDIDGWAHANATNNGRCGSSSFGDRGSASFRFDLPCHLDETTHHVSLAPTGDQSVTSVSGNHVVSQNSNSSAIVTTYSVSSLHCNAIRPSCYFVRTRLFFYA